MWQGSVKEVLPHAVDHEGKKFDGGIDTFVNDPTSPIKSITPTYTSLGKPEQES